MNRRKLLKGLGLAPLAVIPLAVKSDPLKSDWDWADGYIDGIKAAKSPSGAYGAWMQSKRTDPIEQFTLRRGGFGHLRSIGNYPTNPNKLIAGQMVTYDKRVGGAAGYSTRVTISEKIEGVIAHATKDSFVVCSLDG